MDISDNNNGGTVTSSASSDTIVHDGQFVLLECNDQEIRFVRAAPKNHVKIGKVRVTVDPIIGQPWGSLWELKNKTLEKVEIPSDDEAEAQDQELGSVEDNVVEGFEADPQKLSEKEIREMKAKGVDADTIVKALVENSASFKEKTEFAKKKYIAKKKNKYKRVIKLLQPNTLSISQAYFQKKALKINCMRFDSLAQLLLLSNVQAGSQVLVVETCSGLLLGAVTERLGGSGRILDIHPGPQPSFKIFDFFNFPEIVQRTLHHFPLDKIPTLQPKASKAIQEVKETTKSKDEELKDWIEKGSDSLIISTTYDPQPLLLQLLPFLAPSRPFVVFCQYLEPLANCYNTLIQHNIAVNLELTETWTRIYQVLPNRTHPLMNMNGASGYLLSGIKLKSSNETANTNARKEYSKQPEIKKQRTEAEPNAAANTTS